MKIGYILPNGEFLDIVALGYKNHYYYENDLIAKGELPKINKAFSKQLVDTKNYIRVNDGTYMYMEHIVELPINPITSEQYTTLIQFLDYMYYSNKEFVDIGIEKNSRGPRFTHNATWFKHYEFREYLVDDIIKEIKQHYRSIN